MSEDLVIEACDAVTARSELEALAAVLHACVRDGASVGFVMPFPMAEARAFWTKVIASVEAGGTHLFVARRGGVVVGTGQLKTDTMPNQAHRADVAKLLVHPDARRLGLARGLMTAIEGRARSLGRSLLTLDTRSGDSAEPLYLSMGYVMVGQIPDFARDVHGPRLDATSILYKRLAGF